MTDLLGFCTWTVTRKLAHYSPINNHVQWRQPWWRHTEICRPSTLPIDVGACNVEKFQRLGGLHLELNMKSWATAQPAYRGDTGGHGIGL